MLHFPPPPIYSSGWTALHEASLAGFFEATNELLKAGADVNCKGYEQVTPLHDAVKEGHYKVTFPCLKLKCHLYCTKVFFLYIQGSAMIHYLCFP